MSSIIIESETGEETEVEMSRDGYGRLCVYPASIKLTEQQMHNLEEKFLEEESEDWDEQGWQSAREDA